MIGKNVGTPEREIAMASAELREQNRNSHVRTPIDAKRLADFLAKIEAHEAVLLQRQRDIESHVVVYHGEQNRLPLPEALPFVSKSVVTQSEEASPLSSRFAPVDLTTLHVYEEYR